VCRGARNRSGELFHRGTGIGQMLGRCMRVSHGERREHRIRRPIEHWRDSGIARRPVRRMRSRGTRVVWRLGGLLDATRGIQRRGSVERPGWQGSATGRTCLRRKQGRTFWLPHPIRWGRRERIALIGSLGAESPFWGQGPADARRTPPLFGSGVVRTSILPKRQAELPALPT